MIFSVSVLLVLVAAIEALINSPSAQDSLEEKWDRAAAFRDRLAFALRTILNNRSLNTGTLT